MSFSNKLFKKHLIDEVLDGAQSRNVTFFSHFYGLTQTAN